MCFFLNIIDFMQMGLIIVDFGERDRDKREREREEHWVFLMDG